MTSPKDNSGVLRKYVVEFIGTFFVVLAICMTVQGDMHTFYPMVAGMILVGLTYAGFAISGSHFNPALSLAMYLRGKLPSGDLLPYMVAQFLGGTLAAMLAGFLTGVTDQTLVTPVEFNIVAAIIAELLGTLLLVFVFLNLTSAKKTSGTPLYGLGIGLVYTAGIFTFGADTIGAFNPAVALGITMANLTSWETIWIYPVGNFVGGVLAAFLSQYVTGPEN